MGSRSIGALILKFASGELEEIGKLMRRWLARTFIQILSVTAHAKWDPF